MDLYVKHKLYVRTEYRKLNRNLRNLRGLQFMQSAAIYVDYRLVIMQAMRLQFMQSVCSDAHFSLASKSLLCFCFNFTMLFYLQLVVHCVGH